MVEVKEVCKMSAETRKRARCVKEKALTPKIALKSVVSALLASSMLVGGLGTAEAKRRVRGTPVDHGDTFEVEVTVKRVVKRKSKRGKKRGKRRVKEVPMAVVCLDRTPGRIVTSDDGEEFRSYADEVKYLRRQARKKKGRKKRKFQSRLGTYQSILKAAQGKCVSAEIHSLEPYTGRFGEAEARILFERFAFGATPERISQAVAEGLDATVEDLLRVRDESHLDGPEADLRCDTYLAGHEQDDPEACSPGNPNDIEPDGIRLGLYHKFLYSPNPFRHRLFMFLHDERMAVSSQAAGRYERYGVVRHIDMLRAAAFTGDYRRFMQAWNQDLLGHLIWLDGASNKGTSPNENYAREFWELGTTGPADLDGNPVYSDIDLAQSALAFSGWIIEEDEEVDLQGESYRIDVRAYSPDRHANGTFTIFGGTPYEAQVSNSDDILRATFAHPRTAEHLAEDIWKEFINPYASPTAIKRLAKVIRDSDYNLIPVMRQVMKSESLYEAKSRKSIIKQPIDLVFGFLRTFNGYPLDFSRSQHWAIDALLSELGQRPLLPDTVFGWDSDKLAGEAFVLPWRNAVVEILEMDRDDYAEGGYDFHLRHLNGISGSSDLIDRYASWLNVTLNDQQKAHLETFLNFHRKQCRSWNRNSECQNGAETYLERELFDPSPLNQDDSTGVDKVHGLMAILMMMPEYRMK